VIHFAVPWLLGAGLVGAAVITALHFLSVRRPPELLLPTARFLDEGRVRAVSSSAKPSDLLLLLLRVAALLLASAAFAVPQWVSRSHRVARLVVADVAVRADSAALLQGLAAKSSTELLTRFVWTDSVDAAGAPGGLRAELAAALPIAVRAATALSANVRDVDSITLYVVAPTRAAVDTASWRAWRGVWPGAVHVVPPATRPTRQTPAVRFDGVGADDVLRSAFMTRATKSDLPASATDAQPATRDVSVRRAPLALATASSSFSAPAPASASASAPSSSLASAAAAASAASSTSARGGVTVVWPENGTVDGWQTANDTVGALAANGVAVVASWVRASTPSPESMRGAHAVAWWSDGVAAAIERPLGRGCVREVGIVVPPSSDLLLDANADGLMAALMAPCAEAASGERTVPPAIVADSLDTSKGAAASASHFRAMEGAGVRSSPSWLSALLLALALTLLVSEWIVRDRGDRGDRGALGDRDSAVDAITSRTNGQRVEAAP